MLVFQFRLPLRLQGIPRVIPTNILGAIDYEDIDVRDMSNTRLLFWPGLEIGGARYEAEAAETGSQRAHLRIGTSWSRSPGATVRSDGPFLAVVLNSCGLGALLGSRSWSGDRPREGISSSPCPLNCDFGCFSPTTRALLSR